MESGKAFNTEKKEVKLIDGDFTPSQAFDILSALIDQKINYHKIENLQHWEKDHNNDPRPFQERIQKLEEEKELLKKYLSHLRKEGKRLSIDGILTLNPID